MIYTKPISPNHMKPKQLSLSLVSLNQLTLLIRSTFYSIEIWLQMSERVLWVRKTQTKPKPSQTNHPNFVYIGCVPNFSFLGSAEVRYVLMYYVWGSAVPNSAKIMLDSSNYLVAS